MVQNKSDSPSLSPTGLCLLRPKYAALLSVSFLLFLGAALHFESRQLQSAAAARTAGIEPQLHHVLTTPLSTASAQSLLAQGASSGRRLLQEDGANGDVNAPKGQPNPSSLPVRLGAVQVVLSVLLIIVSMVLQLKLQLGLGARIGTAALRCVVQLLLLGLILGPIFDSNFLPVVILWCCFMVAVSAFEVTTRPTHGFRGFYLHTVASLAGPCFVILCYALLAVLGPRNALEARYIIPMLGMLLGNTTTSVTIGYSTLLDDLLHGKERIELMLCMGASRWEAIHPHVQRAMTQGLLPLLNMLSLVGLVSIPGMMTGQILAGQTPMQASIYQILIMFSVAATSTMATLATVMNLAYVALDKRHRLRLDRLKPKERRSVQDYIEQGMHKAYDWGYALLVKAITKASDWYYERRGRRGFHGRFVPGLGRPSADQEGQVLFASPTGSSVLGISPAAAATGERGHGLGSGRGQQASVLTSMGSEVSDGAGGEGHPPGVLAGLNINFSSIPAAGNGGQPAVARAPSPIPRPEGSGPRRLSFTGDSKAAAGGGENGHGGKH